MTEPSLYQVFNVKEAAVFDTLSKPTAIQRSFKKIPKQSPLNKQATVFYRPQSRYLEMNDAVLERLLMDRSLAVRKFAARRLKLLFDTCSRGVREGRIPVEAVNRLSTFCLEITALVENERIVMPTAAELGILFNWYLDMQIHSPGKPGVVLTTVCPDYPFELLGTRAMFKSGVVGNNIGLIGDSILKNAPPLLEILSKTLNMSFDWIVGYAGFEAKPENLKNMAISAGEFRDRLETSAFKLQEKLGVPVGILPGAVDITIEQFQKIRDGFMKKDFNIQRKGMDALSDAVDARDWASVFSIANRLNAIIVDGASVYMGRKAYKKAERILQPVNHTPRFFCVSNYMGFAE
jgi:hypothetical protein